MECVNYLLLPWLEQLELSEANVEGGACEFACHCHQMPVSPYDESLTIFLLDDNDIDGSAEGCRVEGVPGVRHGRGDGSYILHGGNWGNAGRRSGWERGWEMRDSASSQ